MLTPAAPLCDPPLRSTVLLLVEFAVELFAAMDPPFCASVAPAVIPSIWRSAITWVLLCFTAGFLSEV